MPKVIDNIRERAIDEARKVLMQDGYSALTIPAYASCQQDQCTYALPRISGSFSIFLIMICIYDSDQSVAEANNAT